MRFLIIVSVFFILSALVIISNNNLIMSKQENINKFSELYIGWINNIYDNLQKITGQVIELKWLPDEN